jgi:multicomponent Na+:H+ antiporter subunit F
MILSVCFLLLAASLVLCFVRFFAGPTAFDRIVAVESVGAVCVALMVAMALIFDFEPLMDAILAFVLLTFVGTLAVVSYLEKKGTADGG